MKYDFNEGDAVLYKGGVFYVTEVFTYALYVSQYPKGKIRDNNLVEKRDVTRFIIQPGDRVEFRTSMTQSRKVKNLEFIDGYLTCLFLDDGIGSERIRYSLLLGSLISITQSIEI